MDFSSICRKLDVDGIRAKLPAMPTVMPLSQLKMPKLKSRKIFRSSHEDVNASKRNTLRVSSAPPANISTPSEFINHTPQRISTISSLMDENDGDHDGRRGRNSLRDKNRGTYRSAYSVDDDYPIATTSIHFERRLSKPISPVRAPPSLSMYNEESEPKVNNTSFIDKLQKGYKDITEFRFKHLFAKKTVVRKDVIQVDNYVGHYNEDRRREEHEQEKRDREIADNYRFKFKISRQRSGHTNSVTSNESDEPNRKLSQRQQQPQQANMTMNGSGDESGMEESPPRRAPLIEPRRANRTRRNALTQNSLTEDDDEQSPIHRSPTTTENRPVRRGLRRDVMASSNREQSDSEDNIETANKTNVAVNKTKSNTLTSIKSNIQRFQKSIKRSQSVDKTGNETDDDAKRASRISTTDRIAAQLRKFKSQETIDSDTTKQKTDDDGSIQPVHAITTKLKTWKKSLKRQPPSESVQQTDDDMSPTKQSNPNKLMKKLKDMRSKKQTDVEHEEQDKNDEEANVKKANTLENRFTQARQRTLKKMQQINFFHKSQENIGTNDTLHTNETSKSKAAKQKHISTSRRSSLDAKESEYEQDEIEEIIQRQEYPGIAKTMWSTNPILTDSIDSDDCEFPRVVIHQDHTDAFESTLIIAVTRSAMTTPLASPCMEHTELQITEISMKDADDEEEEEQLRITKSKSPEQNIEATTQFLRTMSPPPQSSITKKMLSPQQHYRNDATKNIDVWKSTNDKIEMSGPISEPWKVNSMYKEKLYKTKSIDLFENVSRGGLSTAFEDFDDELKNAPIVRIAPCNMDSFENESEDIDETDDDGSSKSICHKKHFQTEMKNASTNSTKYFEQQPSVDANLEPQIGNSRESLITNVDRCDEEDASDDDEMNRPPSNAPSPPPSSPPPCSPPPAPPSSLQEITLPSSPPALTSPPHIATLQSPRNPPPRVPERVLTSSPCNVVSPPLPLSKPPKMLPQQELPPPRVPERTTSMNRTSKPLVKTSSLRLTFDEQVNPSDIGKVNKLITRFEHPKLQQRPRIVPRLHRSDSADFTDDEENNDLIIYESHEDVLITNNEDIQNANLIQRSDQSTTPTPTPPTIHTTIQKPQANSLCNKPDSKSLSLTKVQEKTFNDPPTVLVSTIPSNNYADATILAPTTSIIIPKISLHSSDQNSNYSCASSEYGSPPEYPSSLMGSTQSTPINDRRQQQQRQQQHLDTLSARRSRRSMTRDDERFFSFDSDEENSYYSISSTGSSRYIVEL